MPDAQRRGCSPRLPPMASPGRHKHLPMETSGATCTINRALRTFRARVCSGTKGSSYHLSKQAGARVSVATYQKDSGGRMGCYFYIMRLHRVLFHFKPGPPNPNPGEPHDLPVYTFNLCNHQAVQTEETRGGELTVTNCFNLWLPSRTRVREPYFKENPILISHT